ncbi:trypsin-like serine protease [Hoeflea sp.]|uniref:trypsin-like serine protease n=1 Tax=Hoeflea sp. TaxID=1940281 RepID=UPI003BB12FE9
MVRALWAALPLLAASFLTSAAAAQTTHTGQWPASVPFPEPIEPIGIRVVGGSPSLEEHVVGIAFEQNGEYRACSGLYISAYRILTAAHCTCNARNFRVSNQRQRDAFYIEARFVAYFGNYDCQSRNYLPRGDDLALLEIIQTLPVRGGSSSLKPLSEKKACESFSLLPRMRVMARYFPDPPKNISVAGYGFNGLNSGERREAVVSLDSALCASDRAASLGCRSFAEFIAGNTPLSGTERDTCGGDSGGPAFFRVKGELVPVGIVSRALPIQQGFGTQYCGRGGIYTSINRYDVIGWLKYHGVPDTDRKCETLPTE